MKRTLIIIAFCFYSILMAGETFTEAKFKALGNCGMCKNRIEKSLTISEVTKASWDKKSKMLSVLFKSDAISVDSLQKLVASVGHDTEKFKAPDNTYNALPECCWYRKAEHSH